MMSENSAQSLCEKKLYLEKKKKPISNSYNIIGIELARGKFTENFY